MNVSTSLADIAAVILAALALWKAFTTARPEAQKLSSDAQASEADAAESYANVAIKYADELRKLRDELSGLEGRMRAQEIELGKVRQENADLRDWAERLVFQVRSLGHEPVKMRGPTPKPGGG